MAAPRRSVLLVVFGVLAVAIAGSYYFFVVHARKQELGQAWAQIEQWEVHWRASWECLFGTSPPAADPTDALVARSVLAHDDSTTEVVGCARQLGKLVRPPGNASAFDGVEAAWRRVEEEAPAVATRYLAYHQDAGAAAALAEALARMNRAWGALRSAAELPPVSLPLGPPLREMATARLVLEGQAITELVPSDAGAALEGRMQAGGRWYHGALVRGGDVLEGRAVPAEPELVVAGPDAAWGLRAVFDERREGVLRLVSGARTEQGSLAAPVEIAAAAGLRPAAAVGNAAEHVAVFVTVAEQAAMHVARSSDGGKRWRSQATPVGNISVFAHGATIDAVTESPTPANVVWQRFDAAKLPELAAPVTIADATLVSACPASAAPWALVEREQELTLLRLDDPARTMSPPSTARSLLACDDGGVVLAGKRGLPVVACSAGECVALAHRGAPFFAAVVAGEPVLVSVRQAIVVARTKAGVRAAKLPAGVTVVSAHALDGALLLLVKREDGTLLGATMP